MPHLWTKFCGNQGDALLPVTERDSSSLCRGDNVLRQAKVFQPDHSLRTEHHRTLERIPELPHIARPGIMLENCIWRPVGIRPKTQNSLIASVQLA
jgi:hypothetical protein